MFNIGLYCLLDCVDGWATCLIIVLGRKIVRCRNQTRTAVSRLESLNTSSIQLARRLPSGQRTSNERGQGSVAGSGATMPANADAGADPRTTGSKPGIRPEPVLPQPCRLCDRAFFLQRGVAEACGRLPRRY